MLYFLAICYFLLIGMLFTINLKCVPMSSCYYQKKKTDFTIKVGVHPTCMVVRNVSKTLPKITEKGNCICLQVEVLTKRLAT